MAAAGKRRRLDYFDEDISAESLLAHGDPENDDLWDRAQLFAHIEDAPTTDEGVASSSKRKRSRLPQGERHLFNQYCPSANAV